MISLNVINCVIFSWLPSVLAASVAIWSPPQLGAGQWVCLHENVRLACSDRHQELASYTWHCSNNQSEQTSGNTITIVASLHPVVCTCIATNSSGQEIGQKNFTVVANGAPPIIDGVNTARFMLGFEGKDMNLTTAITSDLPILDGYPKWGGPERPLPSHYNIVNYTSGGVLYNSLLMYNLSYEDDSGNYTITVSNQCGSASLFIFLEVRKVPSTCMPTGVAPMLLAGPSDILTVEGTSVMMRCYFKGNFELFQRTPGVLASYWMINPKLTQQNLAISSNDTDPFRIALYAACSGSSCCTFVSQLTILSIPPNLDKATLACYESLGTGTSSFGNSKINVLVAPQVYKGPNNVKGKPNKTVRFTCYFTAATWSNVTITTWSKDQWPITANSHYTMTATNVGENSIRSTLTVNRISSDDVGQYSCYCYYNRSVVLSNNYVISNKLSANLTMERDTKLSFREEISVTVIAFVVIITLLASVLVVFIYVKFLKRSSRMLVNLVAGNTSDDDCNEKRPLLNSKQSASTEVKCVTDFSKEPSATNSLFTDKLRTSLSSSQGYSVKVDEE